MLRFLGSAEYVRACIAALVEAGIEHIAVLPWLTPAQSPEQFAERLMEVAAPVLE